jgi:phospholipid/cholesterol/gamma-HCH transport system substrate-binding protein
VNTIRTANPYRAGVWFMAVTAAVLLLALGINVSFGLPFNISLSPPGTDYTLLAKFDDANGLIRGADVVVGGHPIGQVTDVHVDGTKSVVTMRINRQYAPIHKGTIARIRYSTLLAQKYIELAPTSGRESYDDGATIPTDQTITPVDFDQFLSALDPETRARLQVVIQQAGDGVDGRQVDINDLLDQLHGLSVESQGGLNAIDSKDPQLDELLQNTAIVSQRLAQSRDNLADLVGSMNTVNGTLAGETAVLAALIHHLADLMTDFDLTLAGNEGNLHQTVVLLDPLIGQLNVAFGTTDGYLAPNLGKLQQGFAQLTPQAESAVHQRDANGNYLRQYAVVDNACDKLNSTFNPDCGAGQPNPSHESSSSPAGSSSTAPGIGPTSGGAGGTNPAPQPTCDPLLQVIGCK